MVKALKTKRKKGNTTEHIEIETSKSPRLVGIQHQGGPPEGQGSSRGALGEGRGAKGRHPALADHTAAKQLPLMPSLSLGCCSAGPWGGIGCKQAPEYCLMEPAKAQINQVRGKEAAAAAAQSLLKALPPTFCPILRVSWPGQGCCFQSHPEVQSLHSRWPGASSL